MAIDTRELIQNAPEPVEIETLTPLEGRSLFEHDALGEAYQLENAPSRLRRILGGLAVAGKIIAKKGLELGAVGAVGALAGLSWLGMPIDGPLHGTAKLTLNSTLSLEADPHGDSQASGLSFPLDFHGFGATINFDNLPVDITKEGISIDTLSKSERLRLGSLYTNYDQYIAQGEDNAKTYAMLYGFMAIAAWMGVRTAYEESKDKEWFKKVPAKQFGRLALVGGLTYLAVSPSTIMDTRPVRGMSVSSEFAGAPEGLRASGGISDFAQNRREYFAHMSKEQKKALKDVSPLFNDDKVFTMLVVEGTGCDTGTTRLDGEAADELNPDVVLDLGDLAFGNTPFDSFCSQDNGQQLRGHDELRVRGNHDPEDGFQAKWISYLDGKTVQKSGVRFSGKADPNEVKSLANEQEQLGDQNRQQTAVEAAKETCKDHAEHPKGPSIFASNQPALGEYVVEDECATIVFGGGTEASMDVYVAQNGKVIQYLVPRANGVKLAKDPEKAQESAKARLPGPGRITYVGLDMSSGDVFFQPITRLPNGSVVADPSELQYVAQAFIPSPSG